MRLYPEFVQDCNAVLDTLDGLVLTGGGIWIRHFTVRRSMARKPTASARSGTGMEVALTRTAVERLHARLRRLSWHPGDQCGAGGNPGPACGRTHGQERTVSMRPALIPSAFNQAVYLTAHWLVAPPSTANSYHHQAVMPADLAPGLVITGQTTDGVIEALEHVDHPWLLDVQWHPERLYELGDEHRCFGMVLSRRRVPIVG